MGRHKRVKLDDGREISDSAIAEPAGDKAPAPATVPTINFFDLPGELRNEVYSLYFQDNEFHLKVPHRTVDQSQKLIPRNAAIGGIFLPSSAGTYTALFRVSHQIRREIASFILRSRLDSKIAPISATSHSGLRSLARGFGPFGLGKLLHLELNWSSHPNTIPTILAKTPSVSDLLKSFTGLKTVDIVLAYKRRWVFAAPAHPGLPWHQGPPWVYQYGPPEISTEFCKKHRLRHLSASGLQVRVTNDYRRAAERLNCSWGEALRVCDLSSYHGDDDAELAAWLQTELAAWDVLREETA